MRFESTKESEHARNKGLKTFWDSTMLGGLLCVLRVK